MDSAVSGLLAGEQFSKAQEQKERELLTVIKEQVGKHLDHPRMAAFYDAHGFRIEDAERLADIPPLPVNVFKHHELRLCDESDVVRWLKSSGTTGTPSRIAIDKKTAFRQVAALTAILKDRLGNKRRPYLVLDTDAVNSPSAGSITARAAAIRGFSSFASSTCYAFSGSGDDLCFEKERVEEFLAEHADEPLLVFGFTYIIWSRLRPKVLKETLRDGDTLVVHGGGWKHLTNQQVDKQQFNEEIARIFAIPPHEVVDFYGMVEQTGLVFLDCEEGRKHAPRFADVIIRDPLSFAPVSVGEDGMIEIVSAIPSSYPGQALLTEDLCRLEGIDDCPCGRKGVSFTFVSRVERAEVRGCGDTFAEGELR